jgi:hypothetical protein
MNFTVGSDTVSFAIHLKFIYGTTNSLFDIVVSTSIADIFVITEYQNQIEAINIKSQRNIHIAYQSLGLFLTVIIL